ncbi:hypothetical protein [Thorsellia kenyensis]|uniref:Uncharacterized protein n=1 Tax=Thorsellia kenyensis TaxID=1549888 RepID=A0ABV6CCV7_9GAMM
MTVRKTHKLANLKLKSRTIIFPLLIALTLYPQVNANNLLYPDTLKNFYSVSCEEIFNDTLYRMTNITYWQKLITCAKSNTSSVNRKLAKQFNSPIMPDALIWSILISYASPTPDEVNHIINLLHKNEHHIPLEISPITDLMFEYMQMKKAVMEQAETTVSMEEYEAIVKENTLLSDSLANAEKKLSNLAEIERQLSQRRQIQLEAQLDAPVEDKSLTTSKDSSEANSQIAAKIAANQSLNNNDAAHSGFPLKQSLESIKSPPIVPYLLSQQTPSLYAQPPEKAKLRQINEGELFFSFLYQNNLLMPLKDINVHDLKKNIKQDLSK